MRFGVFYELQLPRPWTEGLEQKLFQDSLEQVELADRLGFDNIWVVEHHFLEEYSHCSAPEIFLAACSQRTRNIRLGHGVMLMPPGFNHPARAAERIASLDLVSNGRVEWGTGEASSGAELNGYGVPVDEKRAAWREAVEQCASMLAMDPYPGFSGRYFSTPCRNLVPKPVQRPHPPLWIACSNRETIKLAARLGMGALTFAFVDPAEAKQWVDDYYRIFKEECVPIGHAVNPNVCMVSSFGLHQDAQVARDRFREGFLFFQFALAWHYHFGEHVPGRTNIWEKFQKALPHVTLDQGAEGGITDPAGLREYLAKFGDAGVDQVTFVQQAGRTRHEDICAALELCATEVLGEFQAREAERVARKTEELAPYVEAAFRRKEGTLTLRDDQIPSMLALGRQIAERSATAPQTVAAAANPKRVGWREALRRGEADAAAAPLRLA
jgi:alkanesulfonate monooxygenase SsuD/methylene tetrahydromethanopterin reductase-like flavin-dependent oxidoreductase (luciferase family)